MRETILVGPAHKSAPATINEGIRVSVSDEDLLNERMPFEGNKRNMPNAPVGRNQIMVERDGIATLL